MIPRSWRPPKRLMSTGERIILGSEPAGRGRDLLKRNTYVVLMFRAFLTQQEQ